MSCNCGNTNLGNCGCSSPIVTISSLTGPTGATGATGPAGASILYNPITGPFANSSVSAVRHTLIDSTGNLSRYQVDANELLTAGDMLEIKLYFTLIAHPVPPLAGPTRLALYLSYGATDIWTKVWKTPKPTDTELMVTVKLVRGADATTQYTVGDSVEYFAPGEPILDNPLTGITEDTSTAKYLTVQGNLGLATAVDYLQLKQFTVTKYKI